MNSLTDEALAMTVAETTMQDWLAALNLLKQSPAPIYSAPTPRLDAVILRPRPRPRPVSARAGSTSRTRTVAPAPADDDPTPVRVAGARSSYWVVLAVALGVLALM